MSLLLQFLFFVVILVCYCDVVAVVNSWAMSFHYDILFSVVTVFCLLFLNIGRPGWD